MNNIVKLHWLLQQEVLLLYMGSGKKGKKSKSISCPDGNTYKENQIYRTYDNKLYKNGKEFHYPMPKLEDDQSFNKNYSTTTDTIYSNYKTDHKSTRYHHKGLRHQ